MIHVQGESSLNKEFKCAVFKMLTMTVTGLKKIGALIKQDAVTSPNTNPLHAAVKSNARALEHPSSFCTYVINTHGDIQRHKS